MAPVAVTVVQGGSMGGGLELYCKWQITGRAELGLGRGAREALRQELDASLPTTCSWGFLLPHRSGHSHSPFYPAF